MIPPIGTPEWTKHSKSTKGPSVSAKLSRKFFDGLPTGAYIVSNSFIDIHHSIYQGEVVALALRDLQWDEIKKVGANQLMCAVFNNRDEYLRRGWPV